ncbi:PilC/PilY family type IV pilus protein [Alysiella crassa]|uniref:Tfp pilus assembly protein, tip-associated adhesin PilY1 n=1 Tax=Alysiella crassa TaxID=153491 RepID=A0A376BMR1_9NEIS|nr:PilC/PilY family type IV pilus protein [Alysiella crassa]UOP06949.1 pilus assembly protein [Alysiella crassa]SSY70913.1 Tfp pilus assembly protein, tip-associated adhesin PilY1 [Alysiella crassa]
MKQKKYTTKRLSRFTAMKPLVFLTLMGLGLNAHALPSPFAHVPLHLQSTTTSTTAGGVPPNVLIQFDDSGSMSDVSYANAVPGESYWEVDGTTVRYNVNHARRAEFDRRVREGTAKLKQAGRNDPTRIDIARRALLKVLENDAYTSKANLGLISLWANETQYNRLQNGSRKYAEDFMMGRREFAMTPEELQTIVRNLFASKGTPAVERYMDAATMLEKAIKYRCQKSYVILFSDGDAISNANIPAVQNNKFKWSSNSAVTVNPNTQYAATYETWLAHEAAKEYDLPDTMTSYLQVPPRAYESNLDHPAMFTYNPSTRNYAWNLTSSPRWGTTYGTYWTQHPDSLPFVANMMLKDLKKSTSSNAVDAANKSWDDDNEYGGQKFNVQNIETFTVGFGKGLSDIGLRALDGMATANNYKSLNASTEEELDAAFAKIFNEIGLRNEVKPPFSTSSITPTPMLDTSSSSTLNGSAAVLLELGKGASEIRFYKLVNTSKTKAPVYSVDTSTPYTIPDYSERNVLFNEGGVNNKVSFLDRYEGSNEKFGIVNAKNPNEWRESLIPWLMRSKPDAEIQAQANNSVKYRIRGITENNVNTLNLGDILDTPLEAAGESKYNRQQYLVTATNDGMLYLFESQNSATNPYKLRMNYMPGGMQRESATDTVMKYYKDLAADNYITDPNNPHLYLLNGGIEVRRSDKGQPHRRLFMSANMGQAGRGSFSLNLAGKNLKGEAVGIDASRDSWVASVPLFETPKETNNRMGYTIGKPGLGRLAINRSVAFSGTGTAATAKMTTDVNNVYYATFVNSGVRHPSEASGGSTESALYVYSTLGEENVGVGSNKTTLGHRPGQLIQKLVANPNGGGLAEPSLLDVNLDGVVDLAYAGDYKGNMYRFDFRDGNSNNWTVSRLFTTKDKQPITSSPAVSYLDDNTFVVVFGTGSDLYQSDLKTQDTQSVYGIYDFIGNPSPTGTAGVGELLEQQMGEPKGIGEYNVRELSKNEMDTTRYKGWYFNLNELGERVTVTPTLLLKTVLLSTRIYYVQPSNTSATTTTEDKCAPISSQESTSATGWIMQFRSDSGGRLPSKGAKDADHFPFVDLTGENPDGTFADRNEKSLISGFQKAGAGIQSILPLVGHDDENIAGGTRNAVDLSGGVGRGLGDVDTELKPYDPVQDRFCYNTAEESSTVMTSDSSDTASGGMRNGTVTAKAPRCAGVSLRRISWREIF